MIDVPDEGPGMTEEQRRLAFDRFWRGATQRTEGFGLGLAIVARLATASGGQAVLSPGPNGLGTAARVTLQAASVADGGQPSVPERGARSTAGP